MKVAIFPLPFYGHLFQIKQIILALKSLGTQVTIITSAKGAKFFEGDDVSLKIFGVVHKQLFEGCIFINLAERGLHVTSSFIEEIIEITQEENFDLVIFDSLCIWGSFFAKIKELPSVSYSAFYHLHAGNWFLIPRVKSERLLASPLINLKRIWRYYSNAYRLHKKWGVMAPSLLNFYTGNADLQISGYLKELSPRPVDPNVRFTGIDVIEQVWELGFDKDWYTGSCIFISLGSILTPPSELVSQWANVFADKPYKVLIKSSEIPNYLPSNVRLVTFVNQIEVLRRTTVFVTHGGWNSLLEATTSSVPVVVLPFTADAMHNSKAFEERGAGLMVDSGCPHDLERAIEAILENLEAFKQSITKIAALNEAAGGAAAAAQIIHEFGVSKQVASK